MLNEKKKFFNLAIILASCLLILLSSSFIYMFGIQPAWNSKAESYHIDASDDDFINGTLHNITISGIGSNAKLVLDPEAIWSASSTSTKPPMMYGMKLAAINGTDKVVLFGGYYFNGWGHFNYNETWIYELVNDTWTKVNPKTIPPGRSFHGMASVENDDKVVIFGGYSYDGLTNTYFNDTWIYDLSDNNWNQSTAVHAPSKRSEHAMSTIYTTDKVLLWGGNDNGSETWVYDLSMDKWTNKFPKGTPKNGKQWPALAPIHGTDKVVLFGGTDDPRQFSSFSFNTFIYDLSANTWNFVSVNNVPTRRAQHAMASIFNDDKVVMFGGYYYINSARVMLNDTWVFDLSDSDWLNKNMKVSPTTRIAHDMVSVYNDDEVVLYAGFGKNSFGIDTHLDDTWIYSQSLYPDTGKYISKPYEIANNATYTGISWSGLNTANTGITIQLRTASSELGLSATQFVGPDGTGNTFYETSPSEIWSGHEQHKWIQYRAHLSTSNDLETPELFNVTIWYNYWPDSIPIAPADELIINFNTPNFDWNFIDQDSNSQLGFQVQIANDSNFNTIDYDSNEQTSSDTKWDFPVGTPYSEISDGTWYWRVRTKDNDGTWGEFCEPWKLIIDTTLPSSELLVPINNGFYNEMDLISGTAVDPTNGTGVVTVEVAIKQVENNKYWDGSKWSNGDVWNIATGTDQWLLNTSTVSWESGDKYQINSRAADNALNIEQSTNTRIFTIDTDEVLFSDPWPMVDETKLSKYVDVGITISDQISVVIASTIEYSISLDGGINWDVWTSVKKYSDASEVKVQLKLEFEDGNQNRIKWRAMDVAGNGPTDSDVYSISVYDIQSENSIPKVKLTTPENETIITDTKVQLNWSLENVIPTNITYDVFLGTVDPPVEKIIENQTETSVVVVDLNEDETYYWTVVPWRRIDGDHIPGVCLSGSWSFNIDTSSIPKVTLTYPEDDAVVNTVKLKLDWQLDYAGIESVNYDLYFGTDSNPELKFSDLTDNNKQLENELVDGETYYWKVVPSVNGVTGKESEIWSFTVDFGDAPFIDFSLALDETTVELKPEEKVLLNGSLKNLGDVDDSIILNLNYSEKDGIIISLSKTKISSIKPNEIVGFTIEIEVSKGVKKQNLQITVEATSEGALDYKQNVNRDAYITLKILEDNIVDSKPKGPKNEDDNNLMIAGIAIIIVVVIVIIIVLFLFNKKKKSKQELKESQTTSNSNDTNQQPEQSLSMMQSVKTIQQPVQVPFQSTGQIQPLSLQQQSQAQMTPLPQLRQQNICTTCGQQKTFLPQNNKFYCYHCQKFD